MVGRMKTFGPKFKRWLDAKGLTCYQLSKHSGMAPMTIHGLTKPGADPKFSTICRLAKTFGLKPHSFLQKIINGENH